MDEKQAKALGELLQRRRTELGLSIRDLERETGIDNSAILRIEQGRRASPMPDTLTKLARALQLPLADIFAYADYIVPSELPGLVPYLRTKFRDAPGPALDELSRELSRIADKYGFDPNGPAAGEDEAPEPPTTKPPRKKGGRHASTK